MSKINQKKNDEKNGDAKDAKEKDNTGNKKIETKLIFTTDNNPEEFINLVNKNKSS